MQKEEVAYQHQFILHAALDIVQDLAWTTSAMYFTFLHLFFAIFLYFLNFSYITSFGFIIINIQCLDQCAMCAGFSSQWIDSMTLLCLFMLLLVISFFCQFLTTFMIAYHVANLTTKLCLHRQAFYVLMLTTVYFT